jgi:hypothetical protein
MMESSQVSFGEP